MLNVFGIFFGNCQTIKRPAHRCQNKLFLASELVVSVTWEWTKCMNLSETFFHEGQHDGNDAACKDISAFLGEFVVVPIISFLAENIYHLRRLYTSMTWKNQRNSSDISFEKHSTKMDSYRNVHPIWPVAWTQAFQSCRLFLVDLQINKE